MNRLRYPVFFALLASLMLAPAIARAQSDERIIYASVVDDKGAPVIGLGVKDFIVREDQVAREILRVSADHDPMQIALLVDDSRAIREREAVYRKAVATFVEGMRSEVTIALITTGSRPTVRVDYTRDRQKLLDAVGRLFGDGRNEMFDAIFESSVGLAKRPIMRPVIVAISTGTGNGWLPSAPESARRPPGGARRRSTS